MNKTPKECVEWYRDTLQWIPPMWDEEFADNSAVSPDAAATTLARHGMLRGEEISDVEEWIREARKHVDKWGRPNELVLESPAGRPVPVEAAGIRLRPAEKAETGTDATVPTRITRRRKRTARS